MASSASRLHANRIPSVTTSITPAGKPADVKASEKNLAADRELGKQRAKLEADGKDLSRLAVYGAAENECWVNWKKAKGDETEVGMKWKLVAFVIGDRYHDIAEFDDVGAARAADDPIRLREIERRMPKRVEARDLEPLVSVAPVERSPDQVRAALAADAATLAIEHARLTALVVELQNERVRLRAALVDLDERIAETTIEATNALTALLEAVTATPPAATPPASF